jgi:iron complex outermembrane receptor protein
VTSRGENCVYGQPYLPGAQAQLAAVYYQPETLTAYEVGYKGKLMGGKLRLNASAFYYDYKNLQLSGIVSVGGTPNQLTTNAGKASVKGVELEAIVQPDSHNRLSPGLDLLDAHYTQYCPHYNTSNVCNDTGLGASSTARPTPRSGQHTYTQPVGAGRIEAAASTRVTSSSAVTAFTYPEQFVTPSHSTTDLTMTYHAPGDHWYLQGYAKNLENFITVNGERLRQDHCRGRPAHLRSASRLQVLTSTTPHL